VKQARLYPWIVAAVIGVIVGVLVGISASDAQTTPACTRVTLPVVVNLDDVKHAHLIAHERAAIEAGQHRTLTWDPDGADARRKNDLKGIPTKPGFDRDEYPPAAAQESAPHADVAYVSSSENRSGGSVLGLAMRPFCDGQRFMIEAGRP